jgi:hypothetical protein
MFPLSATITIHEGKPSPPETVEVRPDVGQIHFKNEDDRDYRLRFKSSDEDFDNYDDPGIDILLPAGSTFTVVIKKDDEFYYKVLDVKGGDVNGDRERPFGPIRN